MFDRLAYNKKWRTENRERWLNTRNAHRARNRDKVNADQARRRTKYVYGITKEEVDALFIKQGGLCALCFEPLVEGRRRTIDHNHTTGKVRSIVHQKCNTMIGYVEKHPKIFEQVKEYLVKYDSDVVRIEESRKM